MPISLPQGFKINASTPVDTRLVLTKAEMLAMVDSTMPSTYVAMCIDDGKIYTYNKTNVVDASTGRFRQLETGSVTASAIADKLPEALEMMFNNQEVAGGLSSYNRNLVIDGYVDATQGQIPAKDSSAGLVWINPVSDATLQAAVISAESSKNAAGNYATQAGNAASQANTYKTEAAALNQQTVNYVNNKFWWGTLAEFNALSSISEGTFYYITV